MHLGKNVLWNLKIFFFFFVYENTKIEKSNTHIQKTLIDPPSGDGAFFVPLVYSGWHFWTPNIFPYQVYPHCEVLEPETPLNYRHIEFEAANLYFRLLSWTGHLLQIKYIHIA